jgi:SAM-dependent methyltransferase
MTTDSSGYTARLLTSEGTWWKRLIPVQAPYQWNLRRRRWGPTLDVGCGLGRNLRSLPQGSVGVDHNEASVEIARRRGHTAFTVEEFLSGGLSAPESFDGLLVAHVLEHMPRRAASDLLRTYLEFLRPGGSVLLICPQERGFASDATHETFFTGDDLVQLAAEVGLRVQGCTSFPLPRWAGRHFPYNEFNVEATKP